MAPGPSVSRLWRMPAVAATRAAVAACARAATGSRSSTASARSISTATHWRGVVGTSGSRSGVGRRRLATELERSGQRDLLPQAVGHLLGSPTGAGRVAGGDAGRRPDGIHATDHEGSERLADPDVQRRVERVGGVVHAPLVEADLGQLDEGDGVEREVRLDLEVAQLLERARRRLVVAALPGDHGAGEQQVLGGEHAVVAEVGSGRRAM